MNKFIKKLNFTNLKRTAQIGSGNLYVIAILGTIVAGSALMVGGLSPKLEPPPEGAIAVEIDPTVDSTRENHALELKTFGILTPTLTPTLTPPPTLPPTVCQERAAIVLVVDTSGSMSAVDEGQTKTRILRLRDALKRFITYFKKEPDTAISLVEFANNATTVELGKISENENELITAINNIADDDRGDTNMKVGMGEASRILVGAKTDFPNYKPVTVLMTDGVPEVGACKYRKYRGPDYDQGPYYYYQRGVRVPPPVPPFCLNAATRRQPTFFNHTASPYDVAVAMKNPSGLNAEIFSLLMFSEPDPNDQYEVKKYADAQILMKAVSSDPDSKYFINSPSKTNLTNAFETIAQKVCPTP